jgi:hypothetical protein
MKAGYKTTEFWAAVAPVLGMLTDKDGANQNTIIICASSLACAYMVSRTALKWKSTK